MSWVTVRVSATRGRDEIVQLLVSEGASCVAEEGADLVTSFPADAVPNDLQSRVRDLDGAAGVTVAPAPDVDYELHGTVSARRVGAIFVVPTWDAASYPRETSIIIEPGGAFGTGDHATTRGVLHLLQKVLRKGDVVADLGAGSAVLSIAAAKLGASRVAAIELDGDAIANAEENVAANGAGPKVKVIHGDASLLLPLVAPVDLVVANIVSGVIVDLLPIIARSLRSGGHAIFSGILVSEREGMLRALDEGGWAIQDEHAEEDWWSVLTARR